MASRVQVLTLHLACDVTGGTGSSRAVARRGASQGNTAADRASSTPTAGCRAEVKNTVNPDAALPEWAYRKGTHSWTAASLEGASSTVATGGRKIASPQRYISARRCTARRGV
jgi:hypothetical protein